MIYDVKENLKQYRGIGNNLDRAIEYLMHADFSGLDAGKYPLSGDEMFALLQIPETKKREYALWESHRQYIDIQFLLRGSEQIGFQKTKELAISKEYDFQKDITFYHENNQGFFVNLSSDSFVICFPTDAHMPLVCPEKPQAIRKVIVKVPVKNKGEFCYVRKT